MATNRKMRKTINLEQLKEISSKLNIGEYKAIINKLHELLYNLENRTADGYINSGTNLEEMIYYFKLITYAIEDGQ